MKFVFRDVSGVLCLEGEAERNDEVTIHERPSPYFPDQIHLYVMVNGKVVLRFRGVTPKIIFTKEDIILSRTEPTSDAPMICSRCNRKVTQSVDGICARCASEIRESAPRT